MPRATALQPESTVGGSPLSAQLDRQLLRAYTAPQEHLTSPHVIALYSRSMRRTAICCFPPFSKQSFGSAVSA